MFVNNYLLSLKLRFTFQFYNNRCNLSILNKNNQLNFNKKLSIIHIKLRCLIKVSNIIYIYWGDNNLNTYGRYLLNRTEKVDILDEICNKLNDAIKIIMNIDPEFIYYGSRNIGYYTIINQNKIKRNYSIHLDFRFYYPQNATNEEVELLYCYIQWLSVTPTGKGKGCKIVKELISIIKTIESIEFVLLQPIDSEARRFWLYNGFVDENIQIRLDKRVKCDACKRLIYKIDN